MSRYVLVIFLPLLMLVASCSQGEKSESDSNIKNMSDSMESSQKIKLTNIPFETINGDSTSLAAYSDKVILIVNVASKCGYTKQYAGLEELYRNYKDSGLVVIGFPANNFGGQEPGSNEEILKFCSSTFDVTFPMMAKVSVLGEDKHELYVQMTEKSDITGEIKWNFSKFLINKEGNLVERFGSAVEPMSDELVGSIQKLL